MLRLMKNVKKTGEAISDKNYQEVRQELMEKTKDLYCGLQEKFESLSKTAKKSQAKTLLSDLSKEAERDCAELDSIAAGNLELNVETAERHYGMFAHLLTAESSSLSEEEKVIVDAIKLSDNLLNVFSIMSSEYRDRKLKTFFDTLSKHEIHRKNELEQLYEELFVRGEW